MDIHRLTTNKMSEHLYDDDIPLHHPAQGVKEFYTFKNKKNHPARLSACNKLNPFDDPLGFEFEGRLGSFDVDKMQRWRGSNDNDDDEDDEISGRWGMDRWWEEGVQFSPVCAALAGSLTTPPEAKRHFLLNYHRWMIEVHLRFTLPFFFFSLQVCKMVGVRCRLNGFL